jgi:transposase
MMSEQFRYYVGVDWARESHRVRVLDAQGNAVAERDVSHQGADLLELCSWLLSRTGAQAGEIAVAIERPRGPVVEILLERGFAVYAINPKQLDRFRDRFSVAGAKDDSRDAHVMADSLRTDQHAFRRLAVDDPLIVQLREWVRIYDELKQQRTRLVNRVREQLWRYYPQAAELTDDVAADWFLDLWQRVPSPAEATRVTKKAIAAILQKHRIRRFDAAEALSILRQQPLIVAPGTVEAATAHIRSMAAQLRLINRQIKEAEQRLDELCAAIETSTPGQICEQHDVAILRSFPGLGRITVAVLLGEALEPLRRREYQALRSLSGSAPVSRRSGKSWIVLRRHACNNRLRNAVYQWSRVAIQHDVISRQRYDALRRRGHAHSRAIRGVGDRLLYVLCTLLKRQTLYDPAYTNSEVTIAA